MHRTVRPALLVPALGALLLGVGCSAPTSPAPTAPEPSAETVAWVDGVCSTLRPFADAIAAGPQTGDASDTAAAVAGLSQFLQQGSTALDGTLTALAATAPSPAAAGDAAVDRMTADLTGQQAALQDAKAKIDAIDVADTQTLATALPAALQGLPTNLDPTAELRADPELNVALDRAATCRALPGAAA